jgi:hypothetical protein
MSDLYFNSNRTILLLLPSLSDVLKSYMYYFSVPFCFGNINISFYAAISNYKKEMCSFFEIKPRYTNLNKHNQYRNSS